MPDYYPKTNITHEGEVIAVVTKGKIHIKYEGITMSGSLDKGEKLLIPLSYPCINPLVTKYDTPSESDHDRILELYNILKLKYEEITNTVFDSHILDENSGGHLDNIHHCVFPKTAINKMIDIFDFSIKVDDSLIEKSSSDFEFLHEGVIRFITIVFDRISSKNYDLIVKHIIHMLTN